MTNSIRSCETSEDIAAWTAHGEELDATDGATYGRGPAVSHEIALEFSVGGDGLGKQKPWAEGNEFFEATLEGNGWEGHAAGTGFGQRDMQFWRDEPLTKEEFDKLVQDALAAKIDLTFITQYRVNEWGESVEGDTSNYLHWEKT